MGRTVNSIISLAISCSYLSISNVALLLRRVLTAQSASPHRTTPPYFYFCSAHSASVSLRRIFIPHSGQRGLKLRFGRLQLNQPTQRTKRPGRKSPAAARQLIRVTSCSWRNVQNMDGVVFAQVVFTHIFLMIIIIIIIASSTEMKLIHCLLFCLV